MQGSRLPLNEVDAEEPEVSDLKLLPDTQSLAEKLKACLQASRAPCGGPAGAGPQLSGRGALRGLGWWRGTGMVAGTGLCSGIPRLRPPPRRESRQRHP